MQYFFKVGFVSVLIKNMDSNWIDSYNAKATSKGKTYLVERVLAKRR